MSDIKVSINCITYNHEPYIRDCLDGLLMQKTNFKYEILVHDDASTDKTSDIIREYEQKYPDIIKPIYQTENQYSKGVKISFTYQYPRAQGKYIAFCEGDDYWTDPNKLQMQYDFMEEHEECSMACHNSVRYQFSNNKELIENAFEKEGYIPIEQFLYVTIGKFVATASIFFRKSILDNYPQFLKDCPIGDLPLRIYSAHVGKVYYSEKVMSVYRCGIPGSWTNRGNNKEYINYFNLKMIDCFEKFDEFTNYQYTDTIKKAVWRYNYSRCIISYDFKGIYNHPYTKIVNSKKRIMMFKFACLFPRITKICLRLRQKCKKG